MAPALAVREKVTARSLQPTNGAVLHDEFLPPLESGDRLSRAEFERRYNARPDIKKAELIDAPEHAEFLQTLANRSV